MVPVLPLEGRIAPYQHPRDTPRDGVALDTGKQRPGPPQRVRTRLDAGLRERRNLAPRLRQLDDVSETPCEHGARRRRAHALVVVEAEYVHVCVARVTLQVGLLRVEHVGRIRPQQVVHASPVAQVLDGEAPQLPVLLRRRMPRTPPEPATARLVERPEDHGHEHLAALSPAPARPQTLGVVGKAVEPPFVMLVLRPAREDRRHRLSRIPRVTARYRIAHGPAQGDDATPPIPLGDPAPLALEGDSVQVRARVPVYLQAAHVPTYTAGKDPAVSFTSERPGSPNHCRPYARSP